MQELINITESVENFQHHVFMGVTDALILVVIMLLILAALTVWQTWE